MDFPSSIRKTKPRARVWEILTSSDTPLSAREIAERDGEIWLSSVYRALEIFEKEHVVEKTTLPDSSECVYMVSHGGHHHYAICMQCKKRTELPSCPLHEHEELVSKDSDFMVVGHTIEVYGYCRDCRKSIGKKNSDKK